MSDGEVDHVGSSPAPPTIAFHHNNPRLWFAALECSFDARNIRKQRSRFCHAVSMLPPDIMQDVEEIILNPPEESPYDVLKEAIIGLLRQSDDKRFHQLMEGQSLGDRKPSQLLTAMRRASAGFNVSDELLGTMWKQKLPVACKQILSTLSARATLNEMATTADAIWSVTDTVGQVSAVRAERSDPLDDRLCRIEQLVSSLSLQQDSWRRSRSQSAPRRSFSRRRSPSSPGGVCWYHRRFGVEARKCTAPCTFTAQHSGNGQGRP